jgi:hypothetical protein
MAQASKQRITFFKKALVCEPRPVALFVRGMDPEHGIEVITHKDRVIDLSSEAGIFKINKGNGTYEELKKEIKNKEWKLAKKKNWWQFW